MELFDPCWLSAFTFVPSMQVRSKSNYRRTARSNQWSQFRSFEDALAVDARLALPGSWPALASDLPLGQRPTVGLVVVAATTIDATNLSKSIADALEGVCYHNDASVRVSTSFAVRTRTPHAVVGLCALEPAAALSNLAAATTALSSAAIAEFAELCGVPVHASVESAVVADE